jgi:hypothetical protein
MKALFKLIVLLIIVQSTGCSDKSIPITDKNLLGSWQFDARTPKSMIFTFRDDHTYTMVLTGEPTGMKGHWRLEGTRLAMKMETFGEEPASIKLPPGPFGDTWTNRVSKLTENLMVWREAWSVAGMRLRRVTP